MVKLASALSPNTSTTCLAPAREVKGDRIGVIASVLCAIHCAVTPLLFLFAPAFGEIWAHPASHWIVALFVVPLALVMVMRGFKTHRKRWIVAVGLLGMALVIVGAMIPYLPEDNQESVADPVVESSDAMTNESAAEVEGEGDFFWVVGEEMPGEASEEAQTEACLDSCCPSLVTDAEGNTTLHVPTASVVTTLGGVALICTHLGNLCACRKRRKEEICNSPFC